MSWNRPARMLVVCAAIGAALTLAGCSSSHPPALSGRPNSETTTTTTAPTSTSTSTTVAGASGSTTTTSAPAQ